MNACNVLEPTYMKTRCTLPMLSWTGCAGVRRKVFCYISCSCLDVSSALKNNEVQAGCVFDVVLYFPSILR